VEAAEAAVGPAADGAVAQGEEQADPEVEGGEAGGGEAEIGAEIEESHVRLRLIVSAEELGWRAESDTNTSLLSG
jgi:hypothetical protein